MTKLIIQNDSTLCDLDAICYVKEVIEMGEISETSKGK